MSQQTVSDEKLSANRQNAQQSTGPRSEQGKQRVSKNALKHGLLARQAVLPDENIHEYDGYITSLEQQYQPADFIEFSLIRQMVDAEWRLRRLTRIETAITIRAVAEKRRDQAEELEDLEDLEDIEDHTVFGPGPEALSPEAPNHEALSPDALAALRETELFGEAMSSCGRTLDTYGRYGARLLRQFERAMNQFTQRQEARAQNAHAAKPQQDSVHRHPPQTEYAPPPPDRPRTSDHWTPYQEPNPDNPIADNPVTLAQSLDPFVRSRLRGDPDRLQTRNTKQTQPDLTNTTETTYQQESAEPRTQVRGPSPPNHPPDR